MPDTHMEQRAEPSAPAVLLHYSIVLTGIGTVFLGPLLPSLTALLRLGDGGGGSLLACQFVGAFLGGWTTGVPLRRSMLRGYTAAIVGYAALAWVCAAVRQPWAARVALAVLGFGIGQLLTSTNLIASVKWASSRGRALTLLNFSWSAGALATSLLLIRLLHRFSVPQVLFSMSALLFLGCAAAVFTTNREPSIGRESVPASYTGISGGVWFYFASLLFIYGGVETCLSEWLTTFDLRYGSLLWFGSPLSQTAFWGTLTITRAIAPALMLRIAERVLLRSGLALAAAALGLLLAGILPATLCASLAGFSLAVWFPLVLTTMVGERARPRQVGQIIAVSGLGASAFQWMMGHLSERLGSLREALWLPLAGIVVLLVLSSRKSGTPLALIANGKSV